MTKETEFTDEQLDRLDKLQQAAVEFFQILAETTDVFWELEDIYELIYEGADILESRGRRIRIPTQVTLPDGTSYITDYTDELEANEIADMDNKGTG